MQEEAARALGRIPSPQSVDALILHLLDQNSDIRITAARSLGRIGDKKAVGALVGCLWESNEELQKACLESLAEIGDEESIRQVMNFLRENNSGRMKMVSSSVAAKLGIFEAAWEIFPNILGSRTQTARKQYAIAIASLLGKPDEFYQYVSGSATVLQGRQKKLVARFADKMTTVYARQQKKTPQSLESLKRALDEDRNTDALAEMARFSRALLVDLFGKNVDRTMLGRIDQKLEIFSWIMEESERFLASPPGGMTAQDVHDTARIIALVAMYFLSDY